MVDSSSIDQLAALARSMLIVCVSALLCNASTVFCEHYSLLPSWMTERKNSRVQGGWQLQATWDCFRVANYPLFAACRGRFSCSVGIFRFHVLRSPISPTPRPNVFRIFRSGTFEVSVPIELSCILSGRQRCRCSGCRDRIRDVNQDFRLAWHHSATMRVMYNNGIQESFANPSRVNTSCFGGKGYHRSCPDR